MKYRTALVFAAAMLPTSAFAGFQISNVKPGELPNDARAALDNCLAQIESADIKRLRTNVDKQDSGWQITFKGYLSESGMRHPVKHTCVTSSPDNQVASVETISFRPQVVETTIPAAVAQSDNATNDTGAE
jgi:hypothetical protein